LGAEGEGAAVDDIKSWYSHIGSPGQIKGMLKSRLKRTLIV
jgi:hypothetical protein